MARFTNSRTAAQSTHPSTGYRNYFIWAIETSVSGRTVTATYKIYAQGNFEPYYDWPTTVTAKVGTTTVWNAVTSPRMPAGSGHWDTVSVSIGGNTYQRCYTLGSGTYTAGNAAEDVSVSFSYKISGSAYYLPPAGTYTVSGTVSLAAVTYTVSYNKGANGTGTNTTDTKTYGVALTLKGAIFTRVGYKQTGWATSDGGSQAYALSGSYTANAAVTLYPVWTATTYINVSGTWKPAVVYINVGGTWKEATVYVNVSGTWKAL